MGFPIYTLSYLFSAPLMNTGNSIDRTAIVAAENEERAKTLLEKAFRDDGLKQEIKLTFWVKRRGEYHSDKEGVIHDSSLREY